MIVAAGVEMALGGGPELSVSKKEVRRQPRVLSAAMRRAWPTIAAPIR